MLSSLKAYPRHTYCEKTPTSADIERESSSADAGKKQE
jgi:hypothetical protein